MPDVSALNALQCVRDLILACHCYNNDKYFVIVVFHPWCNYFYYFSQCRCPLTLFASDILVAYENNKV